MIQGDFVYITDDSWSTSPEHWVSGTSWLTGQAGYLPKNFVTQMAETNTWTVHIALPLCEREIPPTSIPSSTSTGESDFLCHLLCLFGFFSQDFEGLENDLTKACCNIYYDFTRYFLIVRPIFTREATN